MTSQTINFYWLFYVQRTVVNCLRDSILVYNIYFFILLCFSVFTYWINKDCCNARRFQFSLKPVVVTWEFVRLSCVDQKDQRNVRPFSARLTYSSKSWFSSSSSFHISLLICAAMLTWEPKAWCTLLNASWAMALLGHDCFFFVFL